MTLRMLCEEQVHLPVNDIDYLENLENYLPIIAELTGSDVFIDCQLTDEKAIVVAEAKPISTRSAYSRTVVGAIALKENEPAVFNAFSAGMPVRDIKAITQENQSVRQSVVPLRSNNAKTIAVLIQEKDISRNIQLSKKYQQLAREKDVGSLDWAGSKSNSLLTGKDMGMLEINHRIKNNLQIVASILNLQARKSQCDEARKILFENVTRVLSISAIHDILCTSSSDANEVSSHLLFRKIVANHRSFVTQDQSVEVTTEGDDLFLSASKASSVSVVVNELLTNALSHAFVGRKSGLVTITAKKGNLYNYVAVEDNGIGFDREKSGRGLGLDIVSATVRDSLKGTLHFHSDESGTKAIFDFPVED